jgi:hypothetical protein
MVIGMFHNRKNPNRVSRAFLYSALLKNEGADFFYFTAKGVDFTTRTIRGQYYEAGSWKEKVFPFPDVIINAANQTTEKQSRTEAELKKLIPFTSYPVGSKLDVYNRLYHSTVLKEYIIPYRQVKDPATVFAFLERHHKAVIKPIWGHHGEGLISVEKSADAYLVRQGNEESAVSQEELEKMILGFEKTMVIQRFIRCYLKNGTPYDFRIHMQKNRVGHWQITVIVPRVGSSRRVVTNLSQGSQMIDFFSFLKNEFEDEGHNVKRQLEIFALKFVKNFEALYPYQFDELGLDIGLDENHKIWLYEVNWRPGHVFIEVATAKKAVQYALYLAQKYKMKKEKEKKGGNT